jgi:hypothetical protein
VPADVSLPTSTAGDRPDLSATELVLSPTRLSFGPDGGTIVTVPSDARLGFSASDKCNGTRYCMEVVPLSKALGPGDAHAPEFVIAADASTPYQLLSETIYTLGQRGVTSPGILVRSGTSQRVLRFSLSVPRLAELNAVTVRTLKALEGPPVDLSAILEKGNALPPKSATSAAPAPSIFFVPDDASSPPSRASDEPTISLSVLVVSQGFAVMSFGYRMGPGCEGAGSGLTISSYDFGALTRCIARIKGAAPAGAKETTAVLAANPDIPLQTIVSTADALRSSPDGGILFPEVALGVPR